MICFLFLFVCFFLNTYRSIIGLYLSFKIFMRISLFNFILPLLNHSEWTNENTIELCPLFFHFNEKMFCFVCFFVAYCLPKTYHKPLPIYMHSPPKKKRKRKKTPKRKTKTKKHHNNKTKFTNTIKNTSKCG